MDGRMPFVEGQPATSRSERERTSRRIFYALLIPDVEISACIDAIRFAVNSEEKWPAHVTVRGPYDHPIRVEGLNRVLAGNRITIESVGRFRENGQQTVFFRCSGTRLRKVWSKRDFPFNPHITLYDGHSKLIADRLEQIVEAYNYRLDFVSDRLVPIALGAHGLEWRLERIYNPEVMYHVWGEYHSSEQIRQLPEEKRFKLIERICQHLSWLSRSSNSLTRLIGTSPTQITGVGGVVP